MRPLVSGSIQVPMMPSYLESLKASPRFFAWLVPPWIMNKKTVKAVNLVVECKTFMSDVLWLGERKGRDGLRKEFVHSLFGLKGVLGALPLAFLTKALRRLFMTALLSLSGLRARLLNSMGSAWWS